ncbi:MULTISPECIES: transglutaminase family protein [Streptomyces]|uniref:transglutaminase family protein n=1 Tax=Streptomyces TaxID=1883 RepID=UPI0004AA7CF4|nr:MULTISPECIES: transglutaminase family protein [Streptomyces]
MASRLRIRHETRVGYPSPAGSSYNELRMSPLTLPTQTVLDSRVEVTPAASLWTYWDYWGTQVTVFDLADSHTDLSLTATSLVETAPPTPLPTPLDRAEIAARSADSRLTEYLAATPRTTVSPDLAAQARAAADGLDAHQAAAALTDLVRERVSYTQGTTGVHTGAQDAWDQRAGVCQDFAHLTAALLRAAGLPTRYVSGYLHPSPDAELDRPVAGESHAWVEYWAGEWIGQDPTNGTQPGESHVIVARGREYGDVPPHKGVYRGAPGELPRVRVEFTRLA